VPAVAIQATTIPPIQPLARGFPEVSYSDSKRELFQFYWHGPLQITITDCILLKAIPAHPYDDPSSDSDGIEMPSRRPIEINRYLDKSVWYCPPRESVIMRDTDKHVPAPSLPPQAPIVKPEQSFDPIQLQGEDFESGTRTIIAEPLNRFVADRFKIMTSIQQANLLAAIDIEIQSDPTLVNGILPFQLELMRELLHLSERQIVTLERAREFYLNYSSLGRRMWLDSLMSSEATSRMVEHKIFEYLDSQFPAIGYTLAHIYEGGYIGLLTARQHRKNHGPQIQAISETLGFAPQMELIYYVNDTELSARLNGTARGSAERKAEVLINFANGLKEDENGRLVPMKLGRPFDEIIFIDDEDKNLKAILQCLVRDVCSNVLYEAGVRHRTDGIERRITECASAMTERAYSASGVSPSADFRFWWGIVDELLAEFTRQTGKHSDRSTLIENLAQQHKWLPDILKVLDGRSIPFAESKARLQQSLRTRQPLAVGSKRSIVFNDIDGTLVSVNALFYVKQTSDPESAPVLVLNQAQFAEHPDPKYWADIAATKSGVPASELSLSFAHFSDPKLIKQDLLRAMFEGRLTKNPHTLGLH